MLSAERAHEGPVVMVGNQEIRHGEEIRTSSGMTDRYSDAERNASTQKFTLRAPATRTSAVLAERSRRGFRFGANWGPLGTRRRSCNEVQGWCRSRGPSLALQEQKAMAEPIKHHGKYNGSVLVEMLSDYHFEHGLIAETALRSSLAQSFDEVFIQKN